MGRELLRTRRSKGPDAALDSAPSVLTRPALDRTHAAACVDSRRGGPVVGGHAAVVVSYGGSEWRHAAAGIEGELGIAPRLWDWPQLRRGDRREAGRPWGPEAAARGNQVERDGAGRFGRRGRGDATAASTSTAPRVGTPNAELKWGEGAAQQCVAPAACGVSSSDDCCVEDRRRAMLLRRAAGERQPLARPPIAQTE